MREEHFRSRVASCPVDKGCQDQGCGIMVCAGRTCLESLDGGLWLGLRTDLGGGLDKGVDGVRMHEMV